MKERLHWKELKKLSSPSTRTSRIIDEGVASTGFSVSPVTQCNQAYASTEAKSRVRKIGLIGVTRASRIIDEKNGVASTGVSVGPVTQCN
ncbi:uncharacterized protein N7487_010915 [Penicillium crustosum]|uniref:uncharacterized protein n=1 Tax=Penicillium crustosum TaxID=36656 RepID=UPI00239E357D|nr:uncharacterized protein N7487_010915 [Penicillium crustosum]KAJ5393274.1 hypothetical protein N7487_010915 [Penicillium crustosum]